MNKSVKSIACLLLAALTVVPMAACGGGKKERSGATEERPIVFSTEAMDGNFNPFFATSATDSEIAGMTQIGMLGVSPGGDVACGQNEPTVVESYTETEGPEGKYTDYEFVIKNGIKFSNGTALTIKDVLFNLYVYLDPAYTGSATIYSTDIVGLQAYRQQDPTITDSGMDESEFNKQFNVTAMARIQDILNYLDPDEGVDDSKVAKVEADIARVKELFKEEVQTDWTNNAGSQESYKAEYTFTEDWEIYFYVEGIAKTVYYSTLTGMKPLKDKDGKYVTTLTKPSTTEKPVILEDGTEYTGSYNGTKYYADHLVDAIEEAANDQALIAAKKAEQDCTDAEARAYVIQDAAIATVYDAYTAEATLSNIINYWATGDKLREEFVAEARTEYFEKLLGQDGLKVANISGITTKKQGKNDVLCIRINGVDPKAIWNFGFSVAPMYYYSDVDAINKNTTKYPNCTDFGVVYNDANFFKNVIGAPEKTGLPVGAGVYQATNKYDTADVNKNTFFQNNIVYFKRNDHFETVGSGLHSANIKYLRYQVVNSDQIINSIKTGDIDIGEPNATADNIQTMGAAGLYHREAPTNGYGYVGVNPSHVPDIEVRRAIMYAMNINDTLDYYTEELAQPVFRSMSRESWAYPKDAELYYNLYKDVADYNTKNGTNLTDKEFIRQMLAKANWVSNADGKLYNTETKELLELTFTIAGGTDDHPAYKMFNNAEILLEDWGFTITVQNDISALAKLADGKLAVWAAAWSSTVDPDMYQVYHKDSKATSVKNWGYSDILNDSTGQFDDEKVILELLSERIDAARETTSRGSRTEIYATALDYVMELAVELPTYQRNDCTCYNPAIIDPASINQNPTAFAGVIDKVWELNYSKSLIDSWGKA